MVVGPVSHHGVQLKHYEQVVANLLSKVEPQFVLLPSLITSTTTTTDGKHHDSSNNEESIHDDDDSDWPFSDLPKSARVVGNHPNSIRANRKEDQLKSMLSCILRLIPKESTEAVDRRGEGTKTATTIVDFGGGSGHLGIPLALLLPNCKIVVVDLNRRSIDLLHDKAESVIKEIDSEIDRQKLYADFINPSSFENDYYNDHPSFQCCGGSIGNSDGYGDNNAKNNNTNNYKRKVLANLFTFYGPVEDYREKFDMAIALHLCGEATDVCLRKAISYQAASIVVAPCCVGKLSVKAFNPDIFHATGQNCPTIKYPQSKVFCRLITSTSTSTSVNSNDKKNNIKKQEEDWNALAKAADYSNVNEFRSSRNASRRTAKALLETDRRLFLEENMYTTALMKMFPLHCSPKNDILVAWRSREVDANRFFSTTDTESNADIVISKSHLLLSSSNKVFTDHNDWTNDEEAEIKKIIDTFLEKDDPTKQVMIFPTRMGSRQRKLIHYVANKLNIAHWSVGKKDSEKTVAIAKRKRY